MSSSLEALILASRDIVVDLQKRLTAFQAVGPENGGQGEAAKAEFVESWLKAAGVAFFTRCDCPDPRVESGFRPNLVCRIPGRSPRTLWLFGHLDVVPAGDASAWTSPPWSVCEKDGYLYGRGVEDNQQAIVSMLVLAKSLLASGDAPEIGLGLVFMADEERGSAKGLDWILRNCRDQFAPEDLYIVPDGGSPDGSLIEIAEKSQLWLKFTVTGRQCHASVPQHGLNSFLVASRLALALAGLNERFSDQDSLFEPPCSTFTPTQHDANVEAVNMVPGRDVFYMDCRLLPGLATESVLNACQQICADISAATGAAIDIAVEHEAPASAVLPASPVIGRLAQAVRAVYGVEARVCGIGGATVAAFLRRLGLPAVVWSCLENTCHQPNERSSIAATLRDAAVFGRMLA